ncbi:hypothetical protein DXV75_11645 [Alteromonas aestuariivivens]|uniref:DUF6538 domain-containing protein n=2 Tax=Alteromonas aestuariivivens TaxID=1938339 RepID=A0A3D8M668_9ALTE|nr:hypothetical protein DXV75_11645 [Alteromonas aestuariivivens]
MAVPKDVFPVIQKHEFKRSLRTKFLTEAKRVFPAHIENAHNQIELARLKLSGVANAQLNPKDCVILAERWYERLRDEIEQTGKLFYCIGYVFRHEGLRRSPAKVESG